MMLNRAILTYTRNRPVWSLILCFAFWKVLLFLVAIASPGPGYDTSTALLKRNHDYTSAMQASSALAKFVRWDAVYFTQIAHRGVLFEQEWAFGWGFTKLLLFVTRGIGYTGKVGLPGAEALAGLFLAHGFHLLSCLMLHRMSWTISPATSDSSHSDFAFLAACLHIISPAGLFLSAPYAESSFSFFNFTGFYLYVKSLDEQFKGREGKGDLFVLLSGLVFGIAATLRSNGLLSGLLYCFEVMDGLASLLNVNKSNFNLRRLGAVVLGGSLMACCATVPQYLAYTDYCVKIHRIEDKRSWCSRRVPSIYAWVQSHYWHVGFLNYWTVSNLPLFILASPMLFIMTFSALESWMWTWHSETQKIKDKRHMEIDTNTKLTPVHRRKIVQRLAIPQLMMAVLALTTYHVQIITRLSSGYPVWYWWLASMIIDSRGLNLLGRKWNVARGIVRWMVLYALVQGGLFASFLPPA